MSIKKEKNNKWKKIIKDIIILNEGARKRHFLMGKFCRKKEEEEENAAKKV